MWKALRNSGNRLAATEEEDGKIIMKQFIEMLTQISCLSSLIASGAVVLLTTLAGVILFQQCGAEVADILCEEAGVLHPRLWRRVQAVGPVAVIQVLCIHKPNTLINIYLW